MDTKIGSLKTKPLFTKVHEEIVKEGKVVIRIF